MNNDYINWDNWANEQIAQCVETMLWYIREGVSRENAIKIVRESTVLGKEKWEKVLSVIDSKNE